MSGSTAVMIPMPAKETLATSKTTIAARKLALDRLRSKKRPTIPKISSARMRPYSTAKAAIPARCADRRSGAMKVYSIVPSHRSHATVSVMNSKMMPR
jgi:hypothetical protein